MVARANCAVNQQHAANADGLLMGDVAEPATVALRTLCRAAWTSGASIRASSRRAREARPHLIRR
jgi:hypothetical protein